MILSIFLAIGLGFTMTIGIKDKTGTLKTICIIIDAFMVLGILGIN